MNNLIGLIGIYLFFATGCSLQNGPVKTNEILVINSVLNEYQVQEDSQKFTIYIHPFLMGLDWYKSLSLEIEEEFGEYDFIDEIIESLNHSQIEEIDFDHLKVESGNLEIVPKPFPSRLPRLASANKIYLMFSKVGFDHSKNYAIVHLHAGRSRMNGWNIIYLLKLNEMGEYTIIKRAPTSFS